MKKIVSIFGIALILISCQKNTRSQAKPVKRDYGHVFLVSRGNTHEWILVTSNGEYVLPLNLSPALKVHRLKVFFSYEEVSRREDGIPVVRLVTISIE